MMSGNPLTLPQQIYFVVSAYKDQQLWKNAHLEIINTKLWQRLVDKSNRLVDPDDWVTILAYGQGQEAELAKLFGMSDSVDAFKELTAITSKYANTPQKLNRILSFNAFANTSASASELTDMEKN